MYLLQSWHRSREMSECSCHKNSNKCRKMGIHINICEKYPDSEYVCLCRCNKHYGETIKTAQVTLVTGNKNL